MSAALSDTSHTGSSVKESAVVELHVPHRQTKTGVTHSLVSPGDNHFTKRPTKKSDMKKRRVKDKF